MVIVNGVENPTFLSRDAVLALVVQKGMTITETVKKYFPHDAQLRWMGPGELGERYRHTNNRGDTLTVDIEGDTQQEFYLTVQVGLEHHTNSSF